MSSSYARVHQVGEEVHLHRAALVVHLPVPHVGSVLDVERSDPRVDDALGAGDAARIGDPPAGNLLIDTRVELGLTGPTVRERRAGGAGPIHGVLRAADGRRDRRGSWIADLPGRPRYQG